VYFKELNSMSGASKQLFDTQFEKQIGSKLPEITKLAALKTKDPMLDQPVTQLELDLAVKTLTNNKATFQDLIYNEMMKTGINCLSKPTL